MWAMEQKLKQSRAWSLHDFLWQLELFQVAEQSYLKNIKGRYWFPLSWRYAFFTKSVAFLFCEECYLSYHFVPAGTNVAS